MILYNVTVGIDSDVEQEWIHWMLEEHIPKVMGTKMFISYEWDSDYRKDDHQFITGFDEIVYFEFRPGNIHPLLKRNSGKAEAVRRGMLIVVDKKYDLAGYWDADLATPLWTIDRFKALLGNNLTKAVLGSECGCWGGK